jgi:lipoyl(octanoyl) transferase
MVGLLYKDLGRMKYLTALALQERIVELKQQEPLADVILFVEHAHVYTLGRGGKISNVLAAMEVPIIQSSRGGDVTYHGPGQLVVYPLIDLRSKLRKDVHRYLKNFEITAIHTLKDFGLEATRRPPYSGIWVDNRKIAAIGIAVRRGITFHGLALNVNTDLSYFNRIIACGLSWADVTSMAKELRVALNLIEVRDRFLHYFAQIFGYTETKESEELFDLRIVQTGCCEQSRNSTIKPTGTF